jgi:hypothetical protein
MKFEIHFEFRASLRKFQDLNFWDATAVHIEGSLSLRGFCAEVPALFRYLVCSPEPVQRG